MNFLDKINDGNNIVFILFIFIVLLLLIYYFLKKIRGHDKKLIEGLKPPKLPKPKLPKGLKDAGKALEKAGKDIGKGVKDVAEDIEEGVKDLAKNLDLGQIIKELENAFKEIRQVGKIANDAIKKVENLGGQIADAASKITTIEGWITDLYKQVEGFANLAVKIATDIFVNKIQAVFIGLGRVFMDGIINPLKDVFFGVGNIFVQAYNIVEEIAKKIVSLPGCIIYYLIGGTVGSILAIISSYTPSWIKNPIKYIWNATFGRLLDWILSDSVTGYTSASNKCYGFDIDKPINSIEDTVVNIRKAFTRDFGKLDFSKIKV